MEKVNKKKEDNNTDKKLHISDVRKSSCQHNWKYKTFGWGRIPPFRYCLKCNKFKY